jgi:hypothetical protein
MDTKITGQPGTYRRWTRRLAGREQPRGRLHATGSANSTPLKIAPCDSAASRELATQQWFLPPDSSWTVTP